MNQADLKTMLDFHYWARDRLLEALEPLTPEQYNKDLGSSFKSIRDTATHTYAAEWAWHERWQGRSPTALIPPDRGRDLANLIPGARLELLPDCGHIIGTDAEEPAATTILSHLEQNLSWLAPCVSATQRKYSHELIRFVKAWTAGRQHERNGWRRRRRERRTDASAGTA